MIDDFSWGGSVGRCDPIHGWCVIMGTIREELEDSVIVAEASTKAMFRSLLIGAVPIIELGVLVALTLMIASIPLRLIRGVK